MSLSQKYVLITGCSANGLGAALVDVFLQHDYHVFATLRTPSKAPSHFSTLSNITILALDVVSPTDIASAVDAVKKKTGGRLDVLVNNSGRFEVMPALDTSIKEGKKLFDLNFWAPLAMIQAFAPLLIEARGCVVNVSSVAAVLPLYFQSIYSASKAALMNASEIWRLELALLGVRTLTIMTGSVRSNVFETMSGGKVPETSYYAAVAKDIYDLGDGRLAEYAISSDAWAKTVVDAVEKGTTGKVWFGGAASATGWAAWLLPAWMVDKSMTSFMPWVKKIQR